jgi:membrane glycosyltransferase
MRNLRQSMWSLAIAGLVLGSLGMVGGTAVGGQIGPMVIGYGLLIALSALYLVAGLAIRERAWRRLARPDELHPDRLAGRRVF